MKTKRTRHAMRDFVDLVVGELQQRHTTIRMAANRLINAGVPFDVAVRVIASNTC